MKQQRLARAQVSLDAQDFDRFVSSSPSTVEYLTGFRSMASRLYEDSEVFVILAPHVFVLALPFGQVAAAIDSGIDPARLVAFGPFSYLGDMGHAVHSVTRVTSLTEALREAVSVAGGGTRYGLERTRLSVDGLKAINEVLEAGCRSDATNWMANVRAIKTPDEVALLRKAAKLSELAIAAAFETARAGTTEREIADVVAATMVAGGGEPAFLSIQTGERGALGDAYASDRAWKSGEFLRIDTGCIVGGYWADIARTAFLGTPTPAQKRAFDALRVGQQYELDAIKPGVVACDLFNETRSIVRSAGLPEFDRHHCGHGIGLSIYDSPRITPIDNTELQAGMVLCLETPYYAMNECGILTEDTVVLTEGGSECFTSLPRELHVVN